MTKNYFTDEQLNAIHKEICRLEDLESGTSLPVHPLNNVETSNLRRICNLAVEAAIGEPVGWLNNVGFYINNGIKQIRVLRGEPDANDFNIPVYATPQQPKSVADALEEAAKGIDSMVKTYIESGNKHPEVSEGRERCVNKARAAMSCAETVRALIKRNTPKEGE